MLSRSDINSMVADANKLTRIMECEIRYKTFEENEEEDYGYGYDDSQEANWTEWEVYQCSIDKVDEYNINDYDFGNIVEGDLLLLLPKNTNLIKNADEYKIKIGDDVYSAKTKLKEMGHMGNTFLYYCIVCELE